MFTPCFDTITNQFNHMSENMFDCADYLELLIVSDNDKIFTEKCYKSDISDTTSLISITKQLNTKYQHGFRSNCARVNTRYGTFLYWFPRTNGTNEDDQYARNYRILSQVQDVILQMHIDPNSVKLGFDRFNDKNDRFIVFNTITDDYLSLENMLINYPIVEIIIETNEYGKFNLP